MKKRNVGVSGLRIAPVGLSTASWSQDDARILLPEFLEHGGNLITTTPESLSTIAPAIREVGRDNVVIALTVGVSRDKPLGSRVDCSRTAIRRQATAALSAANLDEVDILTAGYWDPKTPPAEVAAALHEAVTTGYAMYAGAAEYAGWQLAVTHGLTAAFHEYSLVRRDAEAEVIPAADHLGVGMIATSPLAHGMLSNPQATPKPETHPYVSDKSHTIVDALVTAAEGLSITPSAAAVAWTLSQPGITGVVVGVRDTEHLGRILPAAAQPLPRQIVAALGDISK